MEPHRFRPHLDALEARENPATPADVLSAAQFAELAAPVLDVMHDRLAGPMRTETLDKYKNLLPQVALAEGWAARVLTEFRVALTMEAAANPSAAAGLAPLIGRAADLQARAMVGTGAADMMTVTIGGTSVVPQLVKAATPTIDSGSSGSTSSNGSSGSDSNNGGTTNNGDTNNGSSKSPPLSTSDASGMTDTIPPLDDPNWQAKPDGLRVWDVVEGDGTPVQANSQISVFYTGWLRSDGTQFETNRTGNPNTFALSGLIKGWQEGLIGMKPGGLRRLDIPSDLAYGPTGSPPKIPGNAPLVFEIKMLAVN
jgi:hypothetical protein